MYQETCTYTQTRLYHMAVYQCQKGETFLHLKLSLKRDVPLVGSGFQNKHAVQFKYFWSTLIMCLRPLLASCVSERAVLSVGATVVPAAELFCSLSRRSSLAKCASYLVRRQRWWYKLGKNVLYNVSFRIGTR